MLIENETFVLTPSNPHCLNNLRCFHGNLHLLYCFFYFYRCILRVSRVRTGHQLSWDRRSWRRLDGVDGVNGFFFFFLLLEKRRLCFHSYVKRFCELCRQNKATLLRLLPSFDSREVVITPTLFHCKIKASHMPLGNNSTISEEFWNLAGSSLKTSTKWTLKLLGLPAGRSFNDFNLYQYCRNVCLYFASEYAKVIGGVHYWMFRDITVSLDRVIKLILICAHHHRFRKWMGMITSS